jgi:hypothetical protein
MISETLCFGERGGGGEGGEGGRWEGVEWALLLANHGHVWLPQSVGRKKTRTGTTD